MEDKPTLRDHPRGVLDAHVRTERQRVLPQLGQERQYPIGDDRVAAVPFILAV